MTLCSRPLRGLIHLTLDELFQSFLKLIGHPTDPLPRLPFTSTRMTVVLNSRYVLIILQLADPSQLVANATSRWHNVHSL
jgi:hypothetical protein